MDYRYHRVQVERFLERLDDPSPEDYEYFHHLLQEGSFLNEVHIPATRKDSPPAPLLTNAPCAEFVTWGRIKRRGSAADAGPPAGGSGEAVRVYQAGYGDEPCSPIAAFSLGDEWVVMYAEPVAMWRCWSRKFRAILLLAAGLGAGDRGSPDLWAEAAWLPHATLRVPDNLPADMPVIKPPGYDADYEQESLKVVQATAPEQATELAAIVSRLAATSGISPSVEWHQNAHGGNYRLMLGSQQTANLFGSLVMALIAVLTSSNGPHRCTECGEAWCTEGRGRRPRRDRARFCGDDCRDNARLRVKRESGRRSRASSSLKLQRPAKGR
jgi:hypothetical protein